jgi:hypothetical protein
VAIGHHYVEVNVTTPANTAVAAAVTTQTGITNSIVNAIDVLVPAGHAGLTGVSVRWNGVTIVPWSPTTAWVIGDDYEKEFQVGEQIGGGLVVVTYNTDAVFAHTHYLRFDVTPFSLIAPAVLNVTPVPVS